MFKKREFYSDLKQRAVSDSDYQSSFFLYKTLKMQNLGDMNDSFNAQDFILLCEIGENRFQFLDDQYGFLTLCVPQRWSFVCQWHIYTSNLVPFVYQRKFNFVYHWRMYTSCELRSVRHWRSVYTSKTEFLRRISCVLYIHHKHENFWGGLAPQMHVHWHIKWTLYVRAGHVVPYRHLFRSDGCPVTVKMHLELHIFLLKTWLAGEQIQVDALTILTKL